MSKNQNNRSSGDWEDRILCRDESCTGTIGPDGRCRVCGLPSEDEPVVSDSSSENYSSVSVEPTAETPLPQTDVVGEDAGGGEGISTDTDFMDNGEKKDSEWEDRTLCRDEECIGTIGPDGHCRVCGLAFKNTDR